MSAIPAPPNAVVALEYLRELQRLLHPDTHAWRAESIGRWVGAMAYATYRAMDAVEPGVSHKPAWLTEAERPRA